MACKHLEFLQKTCFGPFPLFFFFFFTSFKVLLYVPMGLQQTSFVSVFNISITSFYTFLGSCGSPGFWENAALTQVGRGRGMGQDALRRGLLTDQRQRKPCLAPGLLSRDPATPGGHSGFRTGLNKLSVYLRVTRLLLGSWPR